MVGSKSCGGLTTPGRLNQNRVSPSPQKGKVDVGCFFPSSFRGVAIADTGLNHASITAAVSSVPDMEGITISVVTKITTADSDVPDVSISKVTDDSVAAANRTLLSHLNLGVLGMEFPPLRSGSGTVTVGFGKNRAADAVDPVVATTKVAEVSITMAMYSVLQGKDQSYSIPGRSENGERTLVLGMVL